MLKKIGMALLSLWVIVTLTFVMMKAIPGDPFVDEKALPSEVRDQLRDHFGLNDPLLMQYGRYLIAIAKWDLGPSFLYPDRSVNAIIAEGFSVSALLGLQALSLALSGGVFLGVIGALRKASWQDRSIHLLSTLSISIPSFIMAVLLQYTLASYLGWFPVARWGSFWHTILPATALSLMPMAFIARLMRVNMLEVLKQNYIRTAISKGIPWHLVIRRHAIKNAFAPLLPYLGQLFANIITGSFVVEKIFSIPGLGHWFVDSITTRDYTVIMGMTLFFSVLLLASILLTDLLYMRLDPRIAGES